MVKKVINWLNDNRRDVGLVLLVFLVAALPRLVDLGTFLTADEKNWIGRSYEFVRAFKDWRFNDMLQTTHPGVTTLWLSGAAVTGKILTAHIPFSFRNLLHFVTAAQFPIALVNALMVPVIYLLLRRLFGRSFVPLVASLFIALNPFIVGYSRVVHVDALLMSFTFAAALSTLLYAERGFSRSWLVISGIFAGLAVLTKAPAVFLLPFLGLVVLVYGKGRMLKRQFLVDRLRDLILWLLLIAVLFVALWPAMLWVPDPEGNVLLLKRDIGQAAVTPHHMSDSYQLNGSFYLFTLLTRTSPVALLLVGVLLVSLILKILMTNDQFPINDQISNDSNTRRILWMLVAYVFFFVVMMILGAKKGDRYVLPVFPALDVLAVFGLAVVAGLLANFQFSIFNFQKVGRRTVFGALAGVVVVVLGVTVVSYHPYTIAYSNPLLPDNLSQELGWGEGLEQVAAWLNENAPEAVVASWYPEELGAYTSAQVAHINAHEQGRVRYIVLYHNMFGRAPDHYANDFIDEYYKKRLPAYVAQVAGKDYVWVYEKRVYERVVGELVPGLVVEQQDGVSHNMIGVDVLVATYSGKAQAGELAITVRDVNGVTLGQATHAVADIEDNSWVGLKLPEPIVAQDVVVEVQARGTVEDDAPTLRYTRDYEYRPTQMEIAGEAKEGDLGIRFRYVRDGVEFTEDDTRLLYSSP